MTEQVTLSIHELISQYNQDSCPNKLNLTIGVCMGDDKKTYKFNVVKQVAQKLIGSDNFDHGYLGLSGHHQVTPFVIDLVFGGDCQAVQEGRVHAFQSVGGSGALYLGSFLAAKVFSKKRIYVSDPTWGPHYEIFEPIFDEVLTYHYYNVPEQRVDFEGMIRDLENAEANSTVLLHASCHNPTGGGLSKGQWEQIMNLIKKNNLFPFFDLAYQGFGCDLEYDALPLRMFADNGLQFVVAQTFSKNFGIYGERLGFTLTVVDDYSQIGEIHSKLESFVSQSYAIPPAFPVKIVYEILKDKDLKAQWMGEFTKLKERISKIRTSLKESLQERLPNKNFDFITSNEGLFILLDFKGDEARILREKHHIYVLENGRVNLSGLSLSDVDYFTNALVDIF